MPDGAANVAVFIKAGYIAKTNLDSYINGMTIEQIFEDALRLPDDMRADLLQALLESFNLSEELDPEFCAELVRRYEEAKNDPSKLRSHDEVMREARVRLARASDH